ncbi:MAG TPA: hypothetical protein DIW54_14055 [Chitinophagaceae bacterium]|nr:hypothetical protein [Chitinophagaceae bacterium]HCT24375.1 hypothetical protein [Chitinophagaceae bacterium]
MKRIYTLLCVLLTLFTACKKHTYERKSSSTIAPVVRTINNAAIELSATQGRTPSIVFISGFGSELTNWKDVYQGLPASYSKFAYNRAGVGKSSNVAGIRDAATIAAELKNILDAADIKPPYILVAHSMGGIYARMFYHLNKNLVKGMVLVDATHENQLDTLLSSIPQPQRDLIYSEMVAANDHLLSTMPAGSTKEEFRANFTTNYQQIKQWPSISSIPLYVISSRKVTPENPSFVIDIQTALHQQWAIQAGSLGRFVTTEKSGHYIQVEEPQLVITGINWVIAR